MAGIARCLGARVGVALGAFAVLALCVSSAGASVRRADASVQAVRFLLLVTQRPQDTQQLETVGARGQLIRVITSEGGGALSPDRRLIAWEQTGGIYVESLNGSDDHLVLPLSCPDPPFYGDCGDNFVWSPDNRQLLVEDNPHGGLVSVSITTGAVRRVVTPPKKRIIDVPVAWSSGGILYTANDPGGENGLGCCSDKLILATPSGSRQRVIFNAADPIHDMPAAAFSPNGKWIALTTEHRDTQDPRLAIINTSTGATKTVRNFNGIEELPVWSPDSTRFVVGAYKKPLQIFSPTGSTLGVFKTSSAEICAWTRAGIYFLPDTFYPRQLRLIPNGQQTGRPVFSLPTGQSPSIVQPF